MPAIQHARCEDSPRLPHILYLELEKQSLWGFVFFCFDWSGYDLPYFLPGVKTFWGTQVCLKINLKATQLLGELLGKIGFTKC